MEERKYVMVEAEVPPVHLPESAGDVMEATPPSAGALERIEAKMDAVVAATGAEVAGYGATD